VAIGNYDVSLDSKRNEECLGSVLSLTMQSSFSFKTPSFSTRMAPGKIKKDAKWIIMAGPFFLLLSVLHPYANPSLP
jgi:hypothetical protein